MTSKDKTQKLEDQPCFAFLFEDKFAMKGNGEGKPITTLIDNDIRHYRGQNVVDSRVQPTEFVAYWSLRNKTSDLRIPRSHALPIEWISKRTGRPFQNGVRSKNCRQETGSRTPSRCVEKWLSIRCNENLHHHLWFFGFIDHSKDKEIIFFESYVTSANRG